MEREYKGYILSDDKNKLNLCDVQMLIKQTYWAEDRHLDVIVESINNSICYGVYKEDKQVGFARVVTDYATFYWLCDVIIDPQHRKKSLGKQLVDFITRDERIKNLLGVLATKDAHDLYSQYGFHKAPERFMRKPRT